MFGLLRAILWTRVKMVKNETSFNWELNLSFLEHKTALATLFHGVREVPTSQIRFVFTLEQGVKMYSRVNVWGVSTCERDFTELKIASVTCACNETLTRHQLKLVSRYKCISQHVLRYKEGSLRHVLWSECAHRHGTAKNSLSCARVKKITQNAETFSVSGQFTTRCCVLCVEDLNNYRTSTTARNESTESKNARLFRILPALNIRAAIKKVSGRLNIRR